MNNIIKKFKTDLSEYGLEISDRQINQFVTYYEMLVEWNEKMNLTAITECSEVFNKHFLDSVSIVKVLDMSSVDSLIDIGTGAGFPGIPIKIMFPHIKVTLLDSLQKRIGFLNEVINTLELDDIDTVHGRAEDFAKPDVLREKYSLCVSRAVANLSTLSEFCIPFVKVGGCFVSYKSEKADEEMSAADNAIQILGGKISKTESFCIDNNSRTLLVIDKIKETDKKYPRKAGVPLKKPL